MSSSVYRCECGQTFKIGNGSIGAFKRHLDQHVQNRHFFKVVLGVSSELGANSNSNSNPNSTKELE
jgi:hypothetical protein